MEAPPGPLYQFGMVQKAEASRAGALLRVAIGLASRGGRRTDNQDFLAALQGEGEEQVTHGAVAVLADGMGGARGGRIAAELACRSFIDGYFGLPPTLGVAAAAERALASFNGWLFGLARTDPTMTGAACAFSALVLRDRFAHVVHVGDTRVWRLREEELVQLTRDHAHAAAGREHVLFRAVGLEESLRLDYGAVPLELHDRFLITSDGVHGSLAEGVLQTLLRRRGDPGLDADAIVEAALEQGSTDNCSAAVVEVVALPDPDHAGLAALAAALPILPPPAVGASLDGFAIERRLGEGERSVTMLARGGPSGEERVVLKFPRPGVIPEPLAREAFVRELLVGAKASSPFVAETIPLPPERQTQVYSAMPFYEGTTLEHMLEGGPLSFERGLDIATKLARGVAALHRIGVAHRDIKPENVLVADDGQVRLIDLGSTRLLELEDLPGSETPGSQGYVAPEIYDGGAGDRGSDQFALGVTLYRIFTGRFPFDDLQALRRPGFDSPADPAALRRDMPAWLAYALRRSVQTRPEDRYESVGELLHTLEVGSAKAAPRSPGPALSDRNPVLLWQLIALALAILLVVSLAFR